MWQRQVTIVNMFVAFVEKHCFLSYFWLCSWNVFWTENDGDFQLIRRKFGIFYGTKRVWTFLKDESPSYRRVCLYGGKLYFFSVKLFSKTFELKMVRRWLLVFRRVSIQILFIWSDLQPTHKWTRWPIITLWDLF